MKWKYKNVKLLEEQEIGKGEPLQLPHYWHMLCYSSYNKLNKSVIKYIAWTRSTQVQKQRQKQKEENLAPHEFQRNVDYGYCIFIEGWTFLGLCWKCD